VVKVKKPILKSGGGRSRVQIPTVQANKFKSILVLCFRLVEKEHSIS
jgi:hypothetical protein